jgi:hypothetical protein
VKTVTHRYRAWTGIVLIWLLLGTGCGGGDPDAAADAGATMDAAPEGGTAQDATRDARTAVDAAEASEDTGAGTEGGTPADAAPDGSAPDMCGVMGQPCTDATVDCGLGYRCEAGVCILNRPTCDGFLEEECPQEAPVCLHCAGCSYGACFTDHEATCVCGTAEGAAAFECS